MTLVPLLVALAATLPDTDVSPLDTPSAPPVTADGRGDGPTPMLHLGANIRPVLELTRATAGDVLRHLAADPRWRVTRWDGAPVAFERQPDSGDWSVARDGYHASGKATWRVLLRFGPWSLGSDWDESPLVAHWDPAVFDVDYQAWTMGEGPWAGRTASALVAEGPLVFVEVHEVAKGRKRPHTVETMEAIGPYLSGLIESRKEIRETGFHHHQVPEGEPDRGKPRIAIGTVADGVLDMRGRANPGEAAWSWVRVLDEAGQPWAEPEVAIGTVEQLGWSPHDSELFYFQSSFPVPSGDRFKGTAELWAQPVGGGEPRVVQTWEVVVPRR